MHLLQDVVCLLLYWFVSVGSPGAGRGNLPGVLGRFFGSVAVTWSDGLALEPCKMCSSPSAVECAGSGNRPGVYLSKTLC